MKLTDEKIAHDFQMFGPHSLLFYGVYVENERAFYAWKDGVYEMLSADDLKRSIWDYLIESKRSTPGYDDLNISANKADQIFAALVLDHKKRRKDTITPLVALSDKKTLNAETLEIKDTKEGEDVFFKINVPSTALNTPFEGSRFSKFLSECLVKEDGVTPDPELVAYVQEIFGYSLLATNKAHATFFFYGSGRNGKSVLVDVLRELIGDKYIANMTIQTLTTNRFSLSGLLGKKLNIASEEESKYIKSDLFKSLVAGDPVTVERKYGDPFEYRPNVKFIFATNQIPIFDSTDSAIRDRVYIIPFNRYFSVDERDPDLTDTLRKELGVILNWALEGSARLMANSYKFSVPSAVRAMAKTFEREQSSVLTFLDENYEVTGAPEDFVDKRVMYDKYKQWCEDNGRQYKANENFFKDMNNVHRRKIDTTARRTVSMQVLRVVVGVKTTSDKSAFINRGTPVAGPYG